MWRADLHLFNGVLLGFLIFIIIKVFPQFLVTSFPGHPAKHGRQRSHASGGIQGSHERETGRVGEQWEVPQSNSPNWKIPLGFSNFAKELEAEAEADLQILQLSHQSVKLLLNILLELVSFLISARHLWQIS